MNNGWDERFEAMVRARLPFLAESGELAGDVDLRALGLDSLAIVELLVEIEQTYQVEFDDEDLTAETFATPDVLWTSVRRLLEPAEIRD